MKRSLLIVAGLLFWSPLKGLAEDWPYPGTPTISSDFGLRHGRTPPHAGIDVLPTLTPTTPIYGFPIRAIAGGEITRIQKTGKIWYITIQSTLSDGALHEVSYLHIFKNGTLSTAKPKIGIRSPDGRFELRISSVTGRNYIIRRPYGMDTSTTIFAAGAGFPCMSSAICGIFST